MPQFSKPLKENASPREELDHLQMMRMKSIQATSQNSSVTFLYEIISGTGPVQKERNSARLGNRNNRCQLWNYSSEWCTKIIRLSFGCHRTKKKWLKALKNQGFNYFENYSSSSHNTLYWLYIVICDLYLVVKFHSFYVILSFLKVFATKLQPQITLPSNQ